MLTFAQVKRNKKELLALTGLTLKECKMLLPQFAQAYQQRYTSDKTRAGKSRKRKVGGGAKSQLDTIEDKLLFILVYQKTYPLQIVIGRLFGMGQSAANQWIHRLLPVLQESLTAWGVMPERDGPRFAASESKHKESRDYIIDGTERRRYRPKDPEKQAQHYSGKKKLHTDKNIVITQTQTNRVGFLSATRPGTVHDKKLSEQAHITYPRTAIVHKDTAFQGYEPHVRQTYQPKKSRVVRN
jgi:hypothetical protein